MTDLTSTNILPEGSRRKRKRPDRFVDSEDWQQEWSKLLMEDVPENEIDAALLDDDFSEDDDDEDRMSSISEDSAKIDDDDCVMLQEHDEDYVLDDEEESSESDSECSDNEDEFLAVQAGEDAIVAQDAPTSDEAFEMKKPLQNHLLGIPVEEIEKSVSQASCAQAKESLHECPSGAYEELPPAEQALPSFIDAQAPTCAVYNTCVDDEETAAWKLFHEHCHLSESDLKEEHKSELNSKVYNIQMAHGGVSGQKIKGVWRYWFSDGRDGLASRPAKYAD